MINVSSKKTYSEYGERLSWVLKLRFFTSFLFFFVITGVNIGKYFLFGLLGTGIIFGINALLFCALKSCLDVNHEKITILSRIKLISDIVIISILIYISGGINSKYLFMYFIVYFLAYYVLPEHKKFSVFFLLGGIFFLALGILEKTKTFSLSVFFKKSMVFPEYSWGDFSLSVMSVFAFSIIAVLITAKITQNIREKVRRADGLSERLTAIYSVSSSFFTLYESDHIVSNIVEIIKDKIGFSSICVNFKLPGSKVSIFESCGNEFNNYIDLLKDIDDPDDFYDKNFDLNRNYLILDAHRIKKIFNVSKELTSKEHDGYLAIIPLVIRTHIVGYMGFASEDLELFSDDTMMLLDAIGNQIGAIEENVQFFQLVKRGKLQWQNTFDAVKDFILIVDLNGNIVRANKAFVEALEVNYKDIIGKSAKHILKIENEIIIPNVTDRPIFREIQFPGIVGHYLISLYPLYEYEEDKRLAGGVYVISNVSELKETQDRAITHLREKEKLNSELHEIYQGIIMLFAAAIDAKSEWTAGHSERVAYYSITLAEKLNLGKEMIDNLRLCSLLHDVGKIAIPDSILNKTSRLLDDEFELVKRHPLIGEKILGTLPHFEKIIPGVKYHHERYDGKGYPYAIGGEDIPVEARILALADSFDAMVSDRPYRKGLSIADAVGELRRNSGTQFDPALVEPFISVVTEDDEEKIEIETA